MVANKTFEDTLKIIDVCLDSIKMHLAESKKTNYDFRRDIMNDMEGIEIELQTFHDFKGVSLDELSG